MEFKYNKTLARYLEVQKQNAEDFDNKKIDLETFLIKQQEAADLLQSSKSPPKKFVLTAFEVLKVISRNLENCKNRYLAEQINCSEKQIEKCLRYLESQKWIKRTGRGPYRIIYVTQKGRMDNGLY